MMASESDGDRCGARRIGGRGGGRGSHRATELGGFDVARAHDAVLAQIDASRQAQAGPQFWAGYITILSSSPP